MGRHRQAACLCTLEGDVKGQGLRLPAQYVFKPDRPVVILRGNAAADQIQWVNRLDPDRLPDAGGPGIEDAFGMDIAFGTAGLRGELGAGTNFMNIYTVRRATQGIADYMNNNQMKTLKNRGEYFPYLTAYISFL